MEKSEKVKASIPIEQRLLRLPEVLAYIPVSSTAWNDGVAAGQYPQPVRLGPRTVAWRGWEIVKLMEQGVEGRKVNSGGL